MERLSYVRGGAAVAMKRVQGCARVRAQGRKCCDMRMCAIARGQRQYGAREWTGSQRLQHGVASDAAMEERGARGRAVRAASAGGVVHLEPRVRVPARERA